MGLPLSRDDGHFDALLEEAPETPPVRVVLSAVPVRVLDVQGASRYEGLVYAGEICDVTTVASNC